MKPALGFSTLEALCAFMLLNLLGTGWLLWQWQALQAQRETLAFQNAVGLAQDLWQRMQLNPSAANSYQLEGTAQTAHPDCHTQACTPTQWAQADLAEWQRELQLRLPGAQASLATQATGMVRLSLAWPAQQPNPLPSSGEGGCPARHRCWQTSWPL